MRSTPIIAIVGHAPKVQAVIQWQGCAIIPANPYSRCPDAIRGAVRALRRIGYKGEYQVSLI